MLVPEPYITARFSGLAFLRASHSRLKARHQAQHGRLVTAAAFADGGVLRDQGVVVALGDCSCPGIIKQ